MVLPFDMLVTGLTWLLDLLTALPWEATGVGWIAELVVDLITNFLVFYKKYRQIKEQVEAIGEQLTFSNFINVLKQKGKAHIILSILEHVPPFDMLPLSPIADLLGLNIDESGLRSIIGSKENVKKNKGESST